MNKITKVTTLLAALMVSATPAMSTEFEVSDELRAKIEPVLTKSGGELHYFAGPGDMIGVGVNFMNGKQMVVYATPDGDTLFSGVAIDVASGVNLAAADVQKLPAPNFEAVIDRLREVGSDQRGITGLSEGKTESDNVYYVFIDPTCQYCHKTYTNLLKVMAEGSDLMVHYIPVGILGPQAQNLAKEMLAKGDNGGLEILRKLVQKEQYLTTAETVAAGADAFDGNMAVFRELGLSGVPAVVSSVGGKTRVRSGMLTAEAVTQELHLAAVKKVAANR